MDWDAWYLNSNPGPYYPCLDDERHAADVRQRPGLGDVAERGQRNNSLPTVQDLTPSTSYTCKGSDGELSWNASDARS